MPRGGELKESESLARLTRHFDTLVFHLVWSGKISLSSFVSPHESKSAFGRYSVRSGMEMLSLLSSESNVTWLVLGKLHKRGKFSLTPAIYISRRRKVKTFVVCLIDTKTMQLCTSMCVSKRLHKKHTHSSLQMS